MSRSAALTALPRTAASYLIEALYPPVCISCGAPTSSSQALCAVCWREAAFIADPVCDRCGAPVETDLSPAICDACVHAPPAFDRGRAAVVYDGVGRDLALKLKHADRLDIAAPAARWMARAGAAVLRGADYLTPAPLHWTRRLKRRGNQAAELARALSTECGVAHAPDILRRIRATPSQEGRSREGRHANMDGAFAVARGWRDAVKGRRIVLVDDVLTTGATLSAMAETLRPYGPARVDAVIFARVAQDRIQPIFTPDQSEGDDEVS